jgi:HPt (histidine-containing phosphotransfer) domain-containing protein
VTPPNEKQDRLRLTMTAIWERNLPVIRERLNLLDGAAEAVANGTLSDKQRVDAAAAAHKLAGSVGMYGYAEGTDLASRLEQNFTVANDVNAAEIQDLMVALRATLNL